ncbi:MAG: outer membrane lipoprotein-sorting protein [Vicinamibacteria bacterium]
MIALALHLLAAQISAGAIVAHVKENDAKIQDLQTVARMEIVSAGETRTRTFELSLLREGAGYDARIRLREPEAMAGTEFLIRAERGERNQQWAYFPDLDLVREIAGKNEADPFLGSDITYADLAGGAHIDDLKHRLLREETIEGDPCYVMEGVPKHRIAYGKLHGFIRKRDFAVIGAEFFGHEGEKLKEAKLSDIRDLGGGTLLAHRIEVRSEASGRRTILTLSEVKVNEGLSPESFTEESLGQGRKLP